MKKNIASVMPFVIIPIVIPIYSFFDGLILVDLFGCGCVPSAQTNVFQIPYNANDLRLTVFSVLTIGLFLWSIVMAKTFERKTAKIGYCLAVLVWNVIVTLWTVKTFMWA